MKYREIQFKLIENAVLVGEYGFPQIIAVDFIPKSLTAFNYFKSKGSSDFIHFFIDDYQFQRVWNQPATYCEKFKKQNGILGTDFSCYIDIPKAIQVYNIFKNRCLDYYFQSNGINIIPVVSWGDETTYEWCFDGLPENSSLAISTNGCKRGMAEYYFEKGFDIMLEILKPKNIIVYGNLPKHLITENTIIFENEEIKRLRNL